jgi:hypothetical protein
VGVAFLDTLANSPDTSGDPLRNGNDAWTENFHIDYLHQDGQWIDHIPDQTTDANRDSLWRIIAIRYTIPPGIGLQDSSDQPDSTVGMGVADDSLDHDAGYMKFLVRIR